MLPCPMLSTPTLVGSAASRAGSLLQFPGPWDSRKFSERRRFPLHTASPFRQRRDLTLTPVPTPLLPITSIQPLHFHTIAHSFAPRRHLIPPIFNSLRTLLPLTGNSFFADLSPRRRVSIPPIINMSCLPAVAGTLSFATGVYLPAHFDSPGADACPDRVGVCCGSPLAAGVSSATWTPSAHPIIIARSRVQVHG